MAAKLNAADYSAIVAALTQSGLQVFQAIQQANALNAQAEVTPADLDLLETQTKAALDESAVKEALIRARRNVA